MADEIEDLLMVERVLALSMRDQRSLEHLARVGLTARDFPTDQHGEVWSSILAVSDKHGRADPALVESELARALGWTDAGDWVRSIIRNGSARVDDETLALYVERLRQQAGRRRISKLSERIYQEAQEERDVGVIVAEATKELESIAAGSATRGPAKIRDVADLVYREETSDKGGALRIPCGIPAIDRAMNGGVISGLVFAYGAEMGIGKTTFGQHSLLSATTKGPAVYFSLETRAAPFFHGLRAMKAGIRFQKHRHEWSVIAGAHGDLSEMPIFIDDGEGQTAEEIAGKIAALKKEEGIVAAFVDYVQDIERSTRYQRDDLNYAHISKVLRRCAGRSDVALFEMSQLTEPDDRSRGKGKPPVATERDLAWTKQWGKDASYVVILDRKKHSDGPEKHTTRARLTKNRPDMEQVTTWMKYEETAHRLVASDERGEPTKTVDVPQPDDFDEVMGFGDDD